LELLAVYVKDSNDNLQEGATQPLSDEKNNENQKIPGSPGTFFK
jgi:hypothetical protein